MSQHDSIRVAWNAGPTYVGEVIERKHEQQRNGVADASSLACRFDVDAQFCGFKHTQNNCSQEYQP